MTKDTDVRVGQVLPNAAELRMALLEKKLAEMEAREKKLDVEQEKRAEFARQFLGQDVTEAELGVIARLIRNAVDKGEFEAMVYSFPSDLCTDSGRAIGNREPDWPQTLQGKAKELYDRFEANVKPKGYRLKAMIINYPGGKPGDVGLFLNWAPEQHF